MFGYLTSFVYTNIQRQNCGVYIKNKKHGGGVAVFILNTLSYERMNNVHLSEAEIVIVLLNFIVMMTKLWLEPVTGLQIRM